VPDQNIYLTADAVIFKKTAEDNSLPDLAFDHDEIVSLAKEKSINSFSQT
jgi:hypothetical protein